MQQEKSGIKKLSIDNKIIENSYSNKLNYGGM